MPNESDIKIYFINDPNHDYNGQYVFSIKNNHGFKYYLLDPPSMETPTIELKKIDNSILLLKELGEKPISIDPEEDEYIKALTLLEYSLKQNSEIDVESEFFVEGEFKNSNRKTTLTNITSNIGPSDIAIISNTIKNKSK